MKSTLYAKDNFSVLIRKSIKIFMKPGKFSDNLMVSENGIVSGVDRVLQSSQYTFKNVRDHLDSIRKSHL